MMFLKRLASVLMSVSIATAFAAAEDNVYRALLLAEDYGDGITYVIGHKNPDTDTVGCAIAYAYLLNAVGIRAEAAVSGPVNGETAFALSCFGIEVPEVIDNAAGRQFILVDHSAYSQAVDGMENARIVGIIDHHGIGDIANSEMINVRSAPVGAAVSLVYLAYRECGVDITVDMARVMLAALLSDTRNMVRNVTALDREAYEALTGIAAIKDIDEFYKKMAEAITSYGDMTDLEIFGSDYKAYDEAGIRFGIGDVNAFGEEAVRALADRMYVIMEENFESFGVDMLYTIINNKGDDANENMMYMLAYGEGAAEVLQQAYGNYDGTRYFVFKENISRKKDVVPAITAVLESR